MPTQNGIYIDDIEDSPYIVTRNGLDFYFSSPVNMRNFQENVSNRESFLSENLSKRFRVVLDAALFADFQLYAMLEKRVYRVVNGSEVLTQWPHLTGLLEGSSSLNLPSEDTIG